jgi:hypothetical protein
MDYSSYPPGSMPGSSQHVIIAGPPNTDRGSTPHSRRYRRRSPPCQLPVSMITPRTKCTVAETTGSLYGMGTLYGFSSHVRQRPRCVGYGASFSAIVKAVCRCFSIVFTSWTCYKKKPGGDGSVTAEPYAACGARRYVSIAQVVYRSVLRQRWRPGGDRRPYG